MYSAAAIAAIYLNYSIDHAFDKEMNLYVIAAMAAAIYNSWLTFGEVFIDVFGLFEIIFVFQELFLRLVHGQAIKFDLFHLV